MARAQVSRSPVGRWVLPRQSRSQAARERVRGPAVDIEPCPIGGFRREDSQEPTRGGDAAERQDRSWGRSRIGGPVPGVALGHVNPGLTLKHDTPDHRVGLLQDA